MDPYQSCPCGSGKSFKWCCQSFYPLVEKARAQHEEGQHETALRTIQLLVQQHPDSASALGYQAEMLYLNGRTQEADEVLQKAFTINPDFPFGHWMRGIIRKDEGEVIGALIQFRKAAELYDPKSSQVLAEIYAAIFDSEMRLNRPVAARAALEKAIHFEPGAVELREAFDGLFEGESRMPPCARKSYSFRTAEPRRAESWKKVITSSPEAKFNAALTAFERLTDQDERDSAAWFNQGLIRAWLGDNARSIEDLLRSIEQETDLEKNTEAGALIEVLRCGEGMQNQSDYQEHRITFQIQQSQPVIGFLNVLQQQQRLTNVNSDQESGSLSALILEDAPRLTFAETESDAKLGAYLLIVGDVMRIWHTDRGAVSKIADEFLAKIGTALSAPREQTGFCAFTDVTLEAMLFPKGKPDATQYKERLEKEAIAYFEEKWIHKPLKALSGLSPLDASAHPGLSKRLFGVIRFTGECYECASPRVKEGEKLKVLSLYDFERLRRKLGLHEKSSSAQDAGLEIEALSTAELAALEADQLNQHQLEKSFRAALHLDAPELAGKFARIIIDRLDKSSGGDPYPYFNHLIRLALGNDDQDPPLALIDEAQKADEAINEGRRSNDYALQRGVVLAKQGKIDQAFERFEALLDRAPNELRYYEQACETMLVTRQGARALVFAERGIEKARSKNNRDAERHLMELSAAAKKQIG